MNKRYNQKLTEKDILKIFKHQEVVTKWEICVIYGVSIYRVNIVLENMDLKITNHGFKLK